MKTLGMVPITRMGLQKFLRNPNLVRNLAVVQYRTLSQDTGKKFNYNQHQQQQQQQNHGRQQEGRKRGGEILLLAASTAAAFAYGVLQMRSFDLHADDNTVAYENRIRQYSTVDQIFQYFSTYLLSQKNTTGGNAKVVMMAPMDVFNAITPESPGHLEAQDGAAGPGNFIDITQDEIPKLELKKSQVANSVLNDIGKNGLLTYNDFCFLLTILSTPKRHIQTAFEMFDINGNSLLEAREFSYITEKLAFNVGGFGDYRSHSKDKISDAKDLLNEESGLLNFLFGKDRQGQCDKDQFLNFYTSLQDELIELEFREYDKENTGRISELDLGKFLLKNAKLPPKTEKRMLKRIEKVWPKKHRGVSLPSFKNLYQTLAGGDDLHRAISFMDDGSGIDYEQFRKISFWVSQSEMSDHVAKVMFVLLDDDQNGRLTIDEIANILLSWRKSRGFDKLSINVTVGPKK